MPLPTPGQPRKTHWAFLSLTSRCRGRDFWVMTEEDALMSVSEFRKDDERKLRTEKELAALNLKTRFKTAMGGSKSQFFFFGSGRQREREREGFYVWGREDGSVKFDSDFYLSGISL